MPPPRSLRARALFAGVLCSVVLLAGWSGCDRITSSLEKEKPLKPEELPSQGTTLLPAIGGQQPKISLTPPGSIKGNTDHSLASTDISFHIDRQELFEYIKRVADTFDHAYVSMFVVADSTGAWYSYGYKTLRFHPLEQELSKGERELFVYAQPNEANDGLLQFNVALIPKSPTAYRDYKRWLLPGLENMEKVKPDSTERNESDTSQSALGGVQVCRYFNEWVQVFGGENLEYLLYEYDVPMFRVCYTISFDGFTDPFEENECLQPGACAPEHGGGNNPEDIHPPNPEECVDGIVDMCGRCSGGSTGILIAGPPHCEPPCPGDVIRNPQITSSGASGKEGGRFRPCVGSSCVEGTKAVRNDGATPHRGTDITCTEGDPIYAPFDIDMGRLERGYTVDDEGEGYGYWVRGWTTIDGERLNFGVAHLQRDGRASGSIKAGDIIGICGRSGITRASVTTHAHLELGARVVFWSGTRDYLRNPELVLSTKFSQDSSAAPINENPCGQ